MEINKIVLEGLSEIIGVDIEADQMGLDLIEMGILDSLSIINLVVFLENQLGKKIDTKKLTAKDFASANSIINLVEKL